MRNKRYLTRLKPRPFVSIDWVIDQDYISKLSRDEKEWLNQFNAEYYFSSFYDDDGQDLIPKQNRSEIYTQNNARRRDTQTNQFHADYLKPSNGRLTYSEHDYNHDSSTNPENALIDLIDLHTQQQKDLDNNDKPRRKRKKSRARTELKSVLSN